MSYTPYSTLPMLVRTYSIDGLCNYIHKMSGVDNKLGNKTYPSDGICTAELEIRLKAWTICSVFTL